MTPPKRKPGRPKAEPTYPAMLRLTAAQRRVSLERGGARWVKRLLVEAIDPHVAIPEKVSFELAKVLTGQTFLGMSGRDAAIWADRAQNRWDEIRAAIAAPCAFTWIAVCERSPDPWQEVMVYPYPTDYCMTAQLGKSGWTYSEYDRDGQQTVPTRTPTHWMPLPSPPASAAISETLQQTER